MQLPEILQKLSKTSGTITADKGILFFEDGDTIDVSQFLKDQIPPPTLKLYEVSVGGTTTYNMTATVRFRADSPDGAEEQLRAMKEIPEDLWERVPHIELVGQIDPHSFNVLDVMEVLNA